MSTASQTFGISPLFHMKVQNKLWKGKNLKSLETVAAWSFSQQVLGLIIEMSETLPPSFWRENQINRIILWNCCLLAFKSLFQGGHNCYWKQIESENNDIRDTLSQRILSVGSTNLVHTGCFSNWSHPKIYLHCIGPTQNLGWVVLPLKVLSVEEGKISTEKVKVKVKTSHFLCT